MSRTQPYKLMITALTKSKAKFLKFIPMKSFVEREDYDISFRIENIGEQVFPGGYFFGEISWPSNRVVVHSFPIKPLEENDIDKTPEFTTGVLSGGYGLIGIATIGEIPCIYSNDGKPLQVEFYYGKKDENKIGPTVAFDHVKAKTWEEIYEFWALIFAAAGLVIIALEKIFIWLTKWIA